MKGHFMTDMFSKEKRSEIMSRVRSKSGLDRTVHNWLCGVHIKHKMYPKVEMNPDILLEGPNVYVFLDSCFWHGCPLHFREPKSSSAGIDWRAKIRKNIERDKKRVMLPYKWIQVWEHDIRSGKYKDILLKVVFYSKNSGEIADEGN
jgi:DNA mismatch endonuclease (patch repair protein)